MIKNYSILFLFTCLLLTANTTTAQTFDGTWQCAYATWDSPDANATGTNTVNVAVVRENTFFALIGSLSRAIAFPIGYRDATDSTGRLGFVPYQPYQPPFVKDSLEVYWTNPDNGFDNILAKRTLCIAATSDSLAFVTSNDESHNILVFKMESDSVYSAPYRMETGTTERIHGITVADNGYVFVTTYGGDTQTASVLVYKGIKNDAQWSDLHNSAPAQTILLPEVGRALDVAVNEDASLLYVTNYTQHKVYLYTGSPTTGYALNNNFNFEVKDTAVDKNLGGPTGLAFLKKNNLLYVSVDNFGNGTYDLGRIYIVNPNTGEKLDTCDIAQWNFDHFNGVYDNRTMDGKYPNGAGYTSVYGIDVDAQGNAYTPSYNGWAVEKWTFTGQLPTIPITVLGVEKVEGMNPSTFTVAQNYPNPFNPATTIEFGIHQQSKITLKVFDINGALVTTLLKDADFESGTYKISFNASKLASGTYIYTISDGKQQMTKKMIFLK